MAADRWHVDATGRRQFLRTAGAAVGAGVLLADPSEAAARTPRVLAGTGRPRARTGAVGDFYVDTRSGRIYGPKMRRSKKRRPWRNSVNLRGAPGAAGSPGAAGAPGAAGSAGYSVLHGSGPPPLALGRDGEFYLDTATTQLYGPKVGGVWGSPATLTVALPEEWVRRTNQQAAEEQVVPLFQIEPYTAGAAPFQVQMNSFPNSHDGAGSYNHGVWYGWNAARHANELGVGHAKPAIVMGFEDNYYDPGVGRHTVEWYVEYWSADGTTVQMFRPFFAQIAADDNRAHSAIITHDIGTDPDGQFIIHAGDGRNAREFGEAFTVLHIDARRAEFRVDLYAQRDLLAQNIVGQHGVGKDLFIRPGSGDGFVVIGNHDGSANLVTVDNAGNVTLRSGAKLQTFGDGGFMVGRAAQPLGFFGATPVPRPSNVAVNAAAIHAALVKLGLIEK